VESAAAGEAKSQSKAGTDSVDELTAAYGERKAETGETARLKEAPDS
jgi:hypothetical protein